MVANKYSTAKFMQIFKRIVLIVLNESYQNTIYLTMDKIRRIAEMEFPIMRLEVIRDLFILACYCASI